MQKQNQITYTHQELAAALIKDNDIHEGFWGVYLEFGFSAANIPSAPQNEIYPSAVVPVMKIGIQKFDTENNLTVDAAKINPNKK
jgi:hypothetical protein